MTSEEERLIAVIECMPFDISVILIESFQQEHGSFSDDAAGDVVKKMIEGLENDN